MDFSRWRAPAFVLILALSTSSTVLADLIRVDVSGTVFGGIEGGDGAPAGFSFILNSNDVCGTQTFNLSATQTGALCVYRPVRGSAFVGDTQFDLDVSEWEDSYAFIQNDFVPDEPNELFESAYDALVFTAFRELGDVPIDGSAFESIQFGLYDRSASLFTAAEPSQLRDAALEDFDLSFMNFIAESSGLGRDGIVNNGYFADIDGLSISIVPLPPAVLLLGSALGLLGWTSRRRLD